MDSSKKGLYFLYIVTMLAALGRDALAKGPQAPVASDKSKARSAVATTAWPFDQRQILLVRDEKLAFPDEVTTAQFMDSFVKRGRVRWVTQKAGPGQIIPIEIPKDFQWQSSAAIRQLGLKHQVDGIVFLVQRGVQLDMRWYSTVDGEPLFFETVNLPSASNAAEVEMRKKRLSEWLSEIWSRIPGQGYVIKRDMTTVSLEGATQVGLKAGQSIEIRRLLDIQRHPLLKTLVGINSNITGTAKIVSVAEPFSVAKIDYESKTDPIQEGDRYQVKAVEPTVAPVVAAAAQAPTTAEETVDAQGRQKISLFGDDDKKTPVESQPLLGGVVDVSAALTMGTARYEESIAGTNRKMNAFAPGFAVNGKAYVTRSWLVLADISGSFLNYRNLDSVYISGSASSSVASIGFDGAYRFVFLEDGPLKGDLLLSLGYRRFAYSMSQVTNKSLAPTAKVYSGFEFGFAGQIPFFDDYAAVVQARRMFGTTLSESPKTSGSTSTDLYWEFSVGGKYRLNNISELGAGFKMTTASSDFEGSGTRLQPSTSAIYRSSIFYGEYTHKF